MGVSHGQGKKSDKVEAAAVSMVYFDPKIVSQTLLSFLFIRATNYRRKIW